MRRWSLALALGLLGAASAWAQPADCAAAYDEAEARYVERAFSAVVSSLAPCLDGSRATIPAFRLVALAELRQGRIVDSKLTILRMLTLSPSYRADRIQDPPTYVALVQTVRDEIASFSSAEMEAAVAAQGPWDRVLGQAPLLEQVADLPSPEPPVAISALPASALAPRRSTSVSLSVWGGTSSYGGERGIPGASGLEEFSDNAGLSGGLGVEVGVAPAVAFFLDAEVGHFPTLPRRKGPNEEFDEVDSFSEFAQFATVGLRVRPRLGGPVSAVAAAGSGLAFGRRNGEVKTGGALSISAGFDVALSRANSVFATGHATFVGPARAIDGAAQPSEPLDLFSGLRLGVRTRF